LVEAQGLLPFTSGQGSIEIQHPLHLGVAFCRVSSPEEGIGIKIKGIDIRRFRGMFDRSGAGDKDCQWQKCTEASHMQTLDLQRCFLHQGLYDKNSKFMPILKV